jgi:hypothetical protein
MYPVPLTLNKGEKTEQTLTSQSPVEDHGSGWSSLWDEGYSDLWDRGKTSPALVDAIDQERELLNPYTADGKRKRAIVPASRFLQSS